jgi:hypothetical protein
MDDTEKKRQELYRAYPASGNWAKKVRAMHPSQVIAVYLKFKKEGKI